MEENDSARHVRQQRETEALSDAWLWPTGFEEFDFWDLRYDLPKDRKDGRRGFLVFTFVQGVNDDHGRDGRFPEGPDDQFVQLVVQGLVGDPWIRLDQRNK